MSSAWRTTLPHGSVSRRPCANPRHACRSSPGAWSRSRRRNAGTWPGNYTTRSARASPRSRSPYRPSRDRRGPPCCRPRGMQLHRGPRHPAGAPPVARLAALAARRPRAGGGPALASRSPGPAGRLPGPLRRRPGRHPPGPGPGDRDRRLPDRAGGVDQRRTACPRPGRDEGEVATPRRGLAPGHLRRRGRVRPGGDPGAKARGEGVGLLGMRERAALLGGRVVIRSSPGRGTVVRLSVPMQHAEEGP